MIYHICCYYFLATVILAVQGQNSGPDPAIASEDVPTLVAKHGYTVEVHNVITPDDYILELHHLLPKTQNDNNNKVLFLNHGFATNSKHWIFRGPGIALAYMLSDAGYDTWMINNRGNGISMTNNGSRADNFWDFDLVDIAMFDTPTAIDFVLAQTNQTDLTFICHSQGCTMYFIMCLEKPEYEDRVNMYVALAPLLSERYTKLPFQLEDKTSTFLEREVQDFDIGAVMHETVDEYCSRLGIRMCQYGYLFVYGWAPAEIPDDILKVLITINPSSSSSKNLFQILQWIGKENIAKYNYGPMNYQVYGSMYPPTYDLGLLKKTPKFILYGTSDSCIDPESIRYASKRIKNLKQLIKIDNFAHNDMVVGASVGVNVNSKILSLLTDNLK